jgi:hypothetical protein
VGEMISDVTQGALVSGFDTHFPAFILVIKSASKLRIRATVARVPQQEPPTAIPLMQPLMLAAPLTEMSRTSVSAIAI